MLAMALIQRADLVEKIRELFGVTQGSVGGQLVDEIIPVVVVENVSGPDNVSTQYPLRAMGHSDSAAVTAQFSKVGLQNPPRSGVDIFVERLYWFAAGTIVQDIRFGVIAAGPSAGLKTWKDFRVIGTPAGIIWDENATGTLGTELQEVRSLSGESETVELGITLAPGDSIHLQGGSADEAVIQAVWHWIERVRRV